MHQQGEYEGLAKKLSEYVVKLIDHVRGNDELDIILNEGVDGHGVDSHGKLSRLKLALKFNEKQVVHAAYFIDSFRIRGSIINRVNIIMSKVYQ